MFKPMVIGSGLVGWQFLQSTFDRQKSVFQKSPLIQRDATYFREQIASVKSADDLVSDRRLLGVALGAFGLKDDLNNRFFIRKILEDGIDKPTALANRLSDERYKSLARTFAFDAPTGTGGFSKEFADKIVSQFEQQEFEVAVGEQDPAMRLALNFKRGIEEIIASGSSDNANWFRLLGTPPLRSVMEQAMGLPESFGQLDVDMQRDILREKSDRRFGTREVAGLIEDDALRGVLQSYLVKEQSKQFAATGPGQVALMLLQSMRR